MPMIEINDVSKWYGKFQVLTDCTTKVEKGEVIVVCGPSGSGKSTLIKTVNALEPFQKGNIVVDGTKVNAARTNLPKLRARVGMVFQNFELFPAHDDHAEPDHRTDQGAEAQARQGDRARPQVSRSRRPDRAEGQVSRPALRRPAAARGDRAGLVDGPDLHAVRRADLGAGPGNGQRGARCHGRPGQGRHDDDGRHARNGIRAQGRPSRHLHGPGAGSSRTRARTTSSASRARSARSCSCRRSCSTEGVEFAAGVSFRPRCRAADSASAEAAYNPLLRASPYRWPSFFRSAGAMPCRRFASPSSSLRSPEPVSPGLPGSTGISSEPRANSPPASARRSDRLLSYGPRDEGGDHAGELLLVVPRPGTISPWASKATDIAHNCGLPAVERIERGIAYSSPRATAWRSARPIARPLLPLLHDRMTEAVFPSLADAARLFAHVAPRPLESIDLIGRGRRAIVEANAALGLALSADEIDYLAASFQRHRTRPDRRRADDVRAGQLRALPAQDLQRRLDASTACAQPHSLFAMIRHTHRGQSARHDRRVRGQRGGDGRRDGAALLSRRRRPLRRARRAHARR